MAKEIKGFEIWHPPPEPEDEPFTVEPPLNDYLPGWLPHRRPQLTTTGLIWMLLPFYLLIKKRLSFSLIELLIWIGAWGGSSGTAVSTLSKYHCPWQGLVLIHCAVGHLHCMLFTAALYQFRIEQNARAVRYIESRFTYVLIPQLLLFTAFSLLFYLARRAP